MNFSIFSLFFFYWLSIFSCLGYGILISQLFKNQINFKSYGYLGLIGILFLITYAYLSNLFYPHGLIHNSIIVVLGFLSFIYFILLRFFEKKRLRNLIVVFSLLFVAFIIYKPHDDFSYYHFQYTYYLTQFPMLIGVGQFNHGFATPSSIFYLNSLFFLPFSKFALFHISSLLVFGFSNIILLEKLFRYLKKNQANYLSFFLILSIAFINIIFYRLAEHGTDRSAQILIFILIFELIVLLNYRKNFENSLSKVFILLSIIISLKVFYVLYFILLVPVIIHGFVKFRFKLFKLVSKKKSFSILLIIFLSIIFTNLFNSGCLLFPVAATCFENLPWAFSLDHVNHMNNWYEQWSKAGAGPNFRVQDPAEYILYFNWVNNWFDEYFFNKVSDFLLGLIAIILVTGLFVFSNKKKDIKNKDKIFPIYLCLIILSFEWFYNHPSLRYGGYVLAGLLLIIPSSLILERYSKKKIGAKIKFLLMTFIVIFIFRNLDRLDNEIDKYAYKPIQNSHYRFNDEYFKINEEFRGLINYYYSCEGIDKCEQNSKIRIGKIFGKLYFENKQ